MHGLIRACYEGGDDLARLRVRVLHELGKLVSFDAAFLAAADPETMLFNVAFADDALAASGPLFLDNEFGSQPDVNRFAALAEGPDPVASLDMATSGERAASPRWRDIMAPLGMGDEARVALRVEGTTWGFLCLHRSGPVGFSPGDLGVLRRAAPHVGDAIRRTMAAVEAGARKPADTASNGLVIVVDDQVAAVGGGAEYWLHEIEGAPVAIGTPLPLPLRAVVRRLYELERRPTAGGPPAVIRLATRSGALLTVEATRLRVAEGAGPVALAIGPAASADRASLLLAAHGLTPAQRRVAQLVLRGHTTRQIVLELRISEHTVQDHLKAVFDKVGVRSRRDLVAAIMRPAG